MTLFSTVLFVYGDAVGYKVTQIDSDSLFLHPVENPDRLVTAPTLQARNEDGIWRISGTQDPVLIDQALGAISVELPSSLQSAAP